MAPAGSLAGILWKKKMSHLGSSRDHTNSALLVKKLDEINLIPRVRFFTCLLLKCGSNTMIQGAAWAPPMFIWNNPAEEVIAMSSN